MRAVDTIGPRRPRSMIPSRLISRSPLLAGLTNVGEQALVLRIAARDLRSVSAAFILHRPSRLFRTRTGFPLALMIWRGGEKAFKRATISSFNFVIAKLLIFVGFHGSTRCLRKFAFVFNIWEQPTHLSLLWSVPRTISWSLSVRVGLCGHIEIPPLGGEVNAYLFLASQYTQATKAKA